MDRILGALYGMAIGDAMGMPSELWSRKRIKDFFGKIVSFLDGPAENEAAKYFRAAQFTDDTSQALVILESLIQTHFEPDKKKIAGSLVDWAERMNAFELNILGPSSKAALLAIKQGIDPKPFTDRAETNGAAMRIPPIGCLFPSTQKESLAQFVFDVAKVTHSSDVAVGGSAMIAMAVSSAIDNKEWDQIINDSISMYSLASKYGAETFSPSIPERLKLAIDYAEMFWDDSEKFSEKIYDIIGTGVLASESVPAAIAIAYYTKEPHASSLLCANLGGDTDTIGAMATAICGAKVGINRINPSWIKVINESNHVDFTGFAREIHNFRTKQ